MIDTGVRSSCDASAMKRRCVASALPRRSSTRLNDAATWSSSAPASTITRRLSGARAVMLRACVAISAAGAGRAGRAPIRRPPRWPARTARRSPRLRRACATARSTSRIGAAIATVNVCPLPLACRSATRHCDPSSPLTVDIDRPEAWAPWGAMGSATGIGLVAAPVASSTATARSGWRTTASISSAACASVRCSASSLGDDVGRGQAEGFEGFVGLFQREAPVQRTARWR